MAFPVPITSVLSGASPRQLAYWRRETRSAPPLLVPTGKRSGRYLYSWADVVALRSIVYLRQEKSLPRIRRAVDHLRRLEADDWTHLAQYSLISTPTTIVVRTPAGELLDVDQEPGTVLDEVLMHDVLEEFAVDGTNVPNLRRPRQYLTVDPRVLGGYPVVAGTRLPFDTVAALADDDLEPAEIVEIYPSMDRHAVPDAVSFARQVASLGA